jgi:hypothetical protein
MLVQVYGDNAMKKTAVYKWMTRFSEGRASVTDEESSGQPAMSRPEENIAKFHQILRENHRLTVKSISEQVNIDRERVEKILTEDLDTIKVCAKMVPKSSPKNKRMGEILASTQITVVEHPSCSLDLACSDFFFVP